MYFLFILSERIGIQRCNHHTILCSKITEGYCNEVQHLILYGNALKEEHRKDLVKVISRDHFPKLTSLTLQCDNYCTLVKAFVVHIPLLFLKLIDCIIDEKDMEGIVVRTQQSLCVLWIESMI